MTILPYPALGPCLPGRPLVGIYQNTDEKRFVFFS